MPNEGGKFKPTEPVRPEPNRVKIEEGQRETHIPDQVSKERGELPQAAQYVKVSPSLGRFLQALHTRLEGAMQTFRLAGTNRVVHDKRGEEKPAERKEGLPEGVAASGKKELEVKEGKTREVQGKTYENYLAERRLPFAERQPEARQKERLLSEFEKLIIERFEQAKKLEQTQKDGKARFLAKTVEQWRAFFEKFLGRTTRKSVELSEIEEFLFRGMVKKGDAKAVVISDIIHNSGRADKFARFGVLYNKLSSLLAGLAPGDAVSKKAIADGLLSEQLMYLALSPPSLEQEIATGMKAKQGIFAAEATEARVAEELGLSYDKGSPAALQHTRIAKEKKRKTGGLFKWLVGDEEVPDEGEGQFIHWWQWGTLKKPGGFTLKRAFYSAVFILLILAILFLINQYLFNK